MSGNRNLQQALGSDDLAGKGGAGQPGRLDRIGARKAGPVRLTFGSVVPFPSTVTLMGIMGRKYAPLFAAYVATGYLLARRPGSIARSASQASVI